MNYTELEGIVLKRVPYRNGGEIINILTAEGRKTFTAYGLNKPIAKNYASCLLLNQSVFTLGIQNQKLTLKEGTCLKNYFCLYDDIVKMTATQAINEMILRFIDEDDGRIYRYLSRFLIALEEGFDPLTLVVIMMAKVILFSGYGLEYNECVICGSKTNIVAVDYNEGGYLCAHCAKKAKETSEYLKSYRYSFLVDDTKLTYHVITKTIALRLIHEFHHYLISRFECDELKGIELFLEVC